MGVDGLLCLGDVVGYGADPVPCLERVRREVSALVAGNHDHGSAGLLDLGWFNAAARIAAQWSAERLSDEERAYLAELPLTAELHDATLVHASPRHPEAWEYLLTPRDGFTAFECFTTRLCFVGHSHRPGVWAQGSNGYRFLAGSEGVTCEPGHRYIVNVGSVGQPRDRDSRAAYALWDLKTSRVTIHRVGYDVHTTQLKIYRSGLPRILGERLSHGL